MEEEIKEWLKKKLEGSPTKKEETPPIETKTTENEKIKSEETEIEQVEKKEPEKMHSPYNFPPKSASVTKEDQTNGAIIRETKKEVPLVKREEKVSEVKTRNVYKILLGTVAILGAVIIFTIFILFYPSGFQLPSIFSANHKYKIFVMHNERPLDSLSGELSYNPYEYILTVYNTTTYCGESIDTKDTIQSFQYTFDSSMPINGNTLKYYEKSKYAFDVYVSATPSSTNSYWDAFLAAKDSYNATLNYNELPKLSKDFSITFDIPIFNNSNASHWTIVQGGNVNVHVELIDGWSKNNSFYCKLFRDYDPLSDSKLPNCSEQLDLFNKNQECVRRYASECYNISDAVMFMTDATKNGKNINCNFPLTKLALGKKYDIRIQTYEQLNPTLYQIYRAKILVTLST